jgi:cullin-associated NEDD8-dissociated protein 1
MKVNADRQGTSRLGSKLPAKAGGNLIPDLKGFLTESDLTNLPYALGVLTTMLESPSASTVNSIEDNGIASLVVDLVKSPVIHGSILEAIQDFFAAYSTLDSDRPVRMVGMIIKAFPVQQPVSSVAVSGDGSAVAYATAAKCIGTVLKHSQANLAGILSQFVKPVQVSLYRGGHCHFIAQNIRCALCVR